MLQPGRDSLNGAALAPDFLIKMQGAKDPRCHCEASDVRRRLSMVPGSLGGRAIHTINNLDIEIA